MDEIDHSFQLQARFREKLATVGNIKYEARAILNKFYNYSSIFSPYVEEVKRRCGRDDLEWLGFETIVAVLESKPVPPSTLEKENWMVTRHNGWQVVSSERAQRIISDFNQFLSQGTREEIKGMAANKGQCIGRVKIIRTTFSDNVTKEIAKVESGDVLVAATTGPELLPAIKLAGAIVTDEGGITSHAAIVSREFNIPCIIGTKVATQILRDGDLVEVDADKGTVRIVT